MSGSFLERGKFKQVKRKKGRSYFAATLFSCDKCQFLNFL